MSDRSERQQWPARGACQHPRGALPYAPTIPVPCFPSAPEATPNPTTRAAQPGAAAVPQVEVPSLPVHQAGQAFAAATIKTAGHTGRRL